VLWAQKTANPDDGYTAIATVYAENREEVPWDAVSEYIKQATIAGEDRRFYDHNGVDLQSIIRAGLGNLTSGGIESGASTLTMQLVKNIFITEALKADTIEERDALIAQAQRGQARDRPRKELHERRDSSRLPEHRRFRRQHLRHSGRGAAVLWGSRV